MPRHGFALLMAIGLLAVIASALVALAALATREAALESQRADYLLARQNARLALLEAVGVLQQEAGRDAAITATAQMLGDTAEDGSSRASAHALLWTGVWRADAPQQAPRWLVSGQWEPTQALPEGKPSAILVAARPAPEAEGGAVAMTAGSSSFSTQAGVAGSMSLTGASTAGDALVGKAVQWEAVRVPLVALPGGAYAWWVGDEGVKVNIAAPNAGRLQAQAWLHKEQAAAAGGEWGAKRLATLLPGPSVNSILPQARVVVVAATAGQAGVIGQALATATEPDDEADAAVRSRIFDISALGQLAEGRPDAAHGYGSGLFHELTFSSRGVLADPLSGLRADYSQAPEQFPLGGQFERYADYASVMETPAQKPTERSRFVPGVEDLRRRYRMRADSATLAQGDVSAAVAPVLTDCYMVFNVHKADAKDTDNLDPRDPNRPGPGRANRVMIHAGLTVELWNPYSSALVPQDLLLEIEGLPERVRMRPQSTAAAVLDVPLAASLRNGPQGSASWWVELPFTDKEYGGAAPSWLPGRVYSWTGPNNYMSGKGSLRGQGASVGNFFHRDLNESAWAQITNVNYPAAAPDFLFEIPARTRLTIRLRLKPQRASQWASAPVLAEIRDVEFDRVPPSGPVRAESLVYQFGFRVRMEDPGAVAGGSAQAWNKSGWLRRADPRASFLSGAELGSGKALGAYSHYVPSPDPRAYVQSTGKGFLGVADPAELWSRPMGQSGLLQVEDAPLFELPRQDLLRVADLRHLHLVGVRPYAIGNRWGALPGNDLNRVFDLGFFSGVRPMPRPPLLFAGEALANERLLSAVEYPQLLEAGGESAAFLLLHGAFNINTRSQTAWRAVLAGALYGDFEYIYSDPRNGAFTLRQPTRTTRLGRAVARYAQSAAETFDTGSYRDSQFLQSGSLHDPAVEPPSTYFRRGLTELSDAQLDLLARNVSRRIGERASAGLPPFRSFAEFLGPQSLASFRHPQESGAYMSILEAAVYDTMADTSLPPGQRLNRDASGEVIWWDTPSFVNAGDLWAQFAHYAAVRSDTFRIRAYGRTESKTGAVLAEAWCEALVQRLPQLHGQADEAARPPAMRTANSDFGRQFRIVSLRWLRRDEL